MRPGKTLGLLTLITTLLTACGGSGGTSTMASSAGSSGGQPVLLSGTISAFGSVVMNGVHYDTDGAEITLNGRSVAQSALAVGQVARLKGSAPLGSGHGHADRVEVDDQVIGPVAAVDAAAGTLTVLGQSVTVDSNTSYGRSISTGDLSGVTAGALVGVSGLVAADGSIQATRIEIEAAGTPYQIVGTVAGLDTANHVFSINGLTVDYGSAAVNGFSSGSPADGDMVVARGGSFDAGTTTLLADQVGPLNDEHGVAGDSVEREGLVTRFASATDFDVALQPVTTTASTMFVNGTAADLAADVRVEAEGTLDANGVLVAERVIIFKAGIAELFGNVTAVDTTAGTVTVLGTTVTVTTDTRLEDRSSAQVTQFSLADLAVGDTVEVRGYENPIGSGTITATRLERESPQTMAMVGGYFVADSAPLFKVLGISVDTSGATFYSNARDGGSDHGPAGSSTLTADQFFAQAPGHVVFASGTLSGTTLTATRILLSAQPDCDGSGAH